MQRRHIKLLNEMIQSCGLSGCNEESINIFLREATKLNLICAPDVLGSVAARIPASTIRSTHYKPRNIMISSHHDTHGHLVNKVNSDGTFNLTTISLEECEGEEGIIRTRNGILPIVFFDVDDEGEIAKARPLDKSLDYSSVRPGDVVTLKPWLGEKIQGKLSGTFLDNKVGCLITLMVMENLAKAEYLHHNTFIVHTSFEETGYHWGTIAAVEKIKPILVINVDMGPVEKRSDIGKGPLICVGPSINRVLSDLAIGTCEDLNIPYNTVVTSCEVSTDIDIIPPLNGGTPACEIDYPGINYHEIEEHVSKRDIDRVVKLVTEMCLRLEKVTSFIPGGLNGMQRMPWGK